MLTIGQALEYLQLESGILEMRWRGRRVWGV